MSWVSSVAPSSGELKKYRPITSIQVIPIKANKIIDEAPSPNFSQGLAESDDGIEWSTVAGSLTR
jgi:hypothetical protein